MNPIVVQHISKQYKSVEALKDISFEVKAGELFGLIGPDGAGKTTLFRVLTTLLLADTGKAFVNGRDVVKDYKLIRREVGYMPGRFSLYQDLTVEENLKFFATIFNTSIKENYDLIRDIYVQIEPFKKRPAGKLSGGMKQKLALCCALVHKPEVLFLDEPTTGVDPVSRKEFWEMLQRLKSKGIAILVSTPYMDEANLCDQVALMQNGQLLQINTPKGVVDSFAQPMWAIRADNMYQLISTARAFEDTQSCYAFGDSLHITLTNGTAQEEALATYLKEKNPGLTMERIQPGIEDCFMYLMKN
ncbi:ABC-type multidrug transport system ATPase subunit [Chitinophaga skermanii]|uniref:ABC-type multidrug transport system ATPase subunit n=1 Tax=Chitinophaga skermanii TaxID=331697 RepID=A0A327QZN9_9BACT|nr:ABC transporter ATP-binding protein [Chitinophaga skermanii]RAJ08913.1 ABC-type multidrug transport system ATPase subunit [Chitinophaga skermanii]